MRSCVGLLLITCMLSSGLALSAQDHPSPTVLLAGLEQNLAPFDRCHFIVAVSASYAGNRHKPGGWSNESQWEVWRDGERWKQITDSRTSLLNAKGERRESRECAETVHLRDGSITVGRVPGTMQPDGILASLGTPSPDEIEAIDGSPCFLPLTGRLFYDDLRIPAIFRSSTLKSKVEELEGRSCNALFGSSARGAITAWLDVGCGLAPRRIVQVKRSGDKVDASKTLEAASRDWGGPFEVVTTRYQAINLELVNGHYVPTHYVVQVTTESPKWGTEVQTWTCKLTQCELAPTFANDAFTVSTPIPNGYPVTVRGQEQIDYEWRNGRIVKKVNASSVANAMGNRFQGGSLLGRGALILGVLAVAGFVLNLWLRRRRASREGAA